MKTERVIEVIKEYQKWLDTPPELDNTGIYIDDNLPNRVELDKALSKAVELMGLAEEAQWLVGNPGTSISYCTDVACNEWQKKYKEVTND